MKSIRIGKRRIGPGEKCFVVAEAGSNHDGSLSKALKLIDSAANCGADAVKFQLFRADRLYPPTAGRSDYLKRKKSIFEIIRSMELSPRWLKALEARCRRRGIILLASVFDEESADLINPHVPAFKVASYELTHLPLVAHVARFGKPVLISSGASDPAEIREAVRTVRSTGNHRIVLCQCTAKYPAPPETLNLRTIPALARQFDVPVGFSDHSADPFSGPLAAVALGAVLIEKHFTLSRGGRGPDHKFSIEPRELAELVRRVRETEAALGDGMKRVLPVEKELHRFARRSIFTARKIHAGEIFTAENLVVLRNGKLRPGLPPGDWDKILGRRVRGNLAAYHGIQRGDIAPGRAVSPIRLRPAARSDERPLWRLRQDKEVIRNSLTGRAIAWRDHRRWFSRLMRNGRGVQWIVEDSRRDLVGQVRLALEPRNSATLHVGIDRRHRGKGYGSSAIAAAAHRAATQWGVERIKAHILPQNRASIEAFRRAGFRLESSKKGVQTWVWAI